MKRVVVTGANGFIGSALCKELSNRGIEVIAIIRDEKENITSIKDLPNVRILYCDLSNIGDLPNLIHEDVDVMYHLAWIGTSGTLRGDYATQIDNIRYSCDAVKACNDIGCKRFVFASSIMGYEVSTLMETEQSPSINTLYSTAKLSAEYMARTLAANFDIDFIRAMISNIYGPGEFSTRMVNTTLRKMITGDYCAFSAGTQMYDFIFIDDAVNEFIAIAEKGLSNKCYYIGSLNPRPLKEFIAIMRDRANPNIEIHFGELPFVGISLDYSKFDVNAIFEDTGYKPLVSFEDGIDKTIAWLKEIDNE